MGFRVNLISILYRNPSRAVTLPIRDFLHLSDLSTSAKVSSWFFAELLAIFIICLFGYFGAMVIIDKNIFNPDADFSEILLIMAVGAFISAVIAGLVKFWLRSNMRRPAMVV